MKEIKARTSHRLKWLVAVLAAALCAPGCGEFSASSNSLQVWGRVTHNGKPVGYGALLFQPAPTNNSPWGIGLISEDGKYSVISAQPDAGLHPGRFDISLRPPAPHDRPKHGPAGEVEVTWEKALLLNYSYPVPKRFFARETSGLWADLEKEPTRLDIDLRD
jgi:hypothetical protein